MKLYCDPQLPENYRTPSRCVVHSPLMQAWSIPEKRMHNRRRFEVITGRTTAEILASARDEVTA